MKQTIDMTDIERVTECLEFIRAGNDVSTKWRIEVENDARKLGLLPTKKGSIGCNCPPIGSKVRFYEAAILARQEQYQD